MLTKGLNQVAKHCFGQELQPGALMSDHSAGCRTGMLATFDAPLGQCYPHIARKLGEGAFCSKKHPHIDVLPKHIRAIHMAQSAKMRDFLTIKIGEEWDEWGTKNNMKAFWNEYCIEPWDNWSIGLFDCPMCTPSQQAHESWHKGILQSRIPGMFKGSTESVMKVALPQLVRMDAALIPDELLFSVPVVPGKMMEKAMWYARRKSSHFFVAPGHADADDEPSYTFYILSKSSTAYTKIDGLLVTRYHSLLMGQRPRGLTRLESFLDVADALHVVEYGDEVGRACLPCEMNPLELVCGCKGFRHIGICSHVIVTTHWLGEYDVIHLCGGMSTEKRKAGGYRKGVRPALEKEQAGKPQKQRRLKK